MHYVNDTKGIRDAKDKVDNAKLEIEIANKEKQIKLIEKEIDLLEEKKESINEQISLLDEEINRIKEFYDAEIEKTKEFYDNQIKAIDTQIEAIDKQIEAIEKQREHTEKYYESLIENLEKSKSKYEELTELVAQAELSAKLKQLGIDEEALLNGSEEEFEKLKNAYMDVVFKLNEGNTEVLSKLQELSGYDGTAPAVLSDSNNKLDEMNGKLDTSNQSVGSVNNSLSDTASKTSDVAANMGEMESSLSGVNTLVSEEQAAFDSLKQKIDEIITAINEKTSAILEEQNAAQSAVSSEIADFELLKEKILEIKESLGSISGTVNTLDTTPVDNLTTSFQLLYDQLLLVSTTLGAGMENQGDSAVSGIASAVQALNEISLEEGIISQFENLKTAIEGVASAISGGGSSGSSGGDASTSSSPSMGSGADDKGSEGGGDSITGAITQMAETANEVIGEPDAEGDGTVIGEFGSMKTAVNDVTSAIGGGEESGADGAGSEGDNSLVSSITSMGETTQETLGEPDGDGVIGRFKEFEGVIEEAANQVRSISEGLDEIDGKEVECTVTINVVMNGDAKAFASGTVLGNMQIESATYNAKYGKAFASGTIGLPHAEKNALVSEYGQTEMTVLPDGRTIVTDTPTMMDLPKDTVIYNEEQTKKIMDNKIDISGNAHADGTDDEGWWTGADGHRYRDIRPGDRVWELQEIFKPMIAKWKETGEEISNAYYDHVKQMEQWTKEITNNQAISNVVNNKNIQQPIHNTFNITMPNVTNSTSAETLMNDLQSISRKKYQVDW